MTHAKALAWARGRLAEVCRDDGHVSSGGRRARIAVELHGRVAGCCLGAACVRS